MIVTGILLAWPTRSWAGPEINIPRAEDGRGLKVGERSTFHPGFALVTGVDTNVFTTNRNEPRGADLGPAEAAFIMPTGWLGIGNRQFRDGMLMSPPERSRRILDYYIGGIIGFRQYLARNRNVLGQSRLSGGLQMRLAFLPGRKFSINFDEDLYRYAQPGTYEAAPQYNFNRIDHRGQLTLTGRPGGGRLSISAGYRNMLLVFQNVDSDIANGNRLINGAAAEVKWRLRPKSALVFNYSFDWTYYLSCCTEVGQGRNEDNFAHRITAGFRGQVFKKMAVDAVGGYGLGFYRQDPNGPNFSSFIGELGLTYFPNAKSLIHGAVYRSFQDSLLGNYYIDVGGRLEGRYEFRWRMVTTLGLWLAGRRYAGLPVPGFEDNDITSYEGRGADVFQRRDVIFNLFARVEQPLGRLFSVALQYDVAVDNTAFLTTFANGAQDLAGFNRHVVLLLGAVRI